MVWLASNFVQISKLASDMKIMKEVNLGQNKQCVNGGGRRKTKRSEKKNRQPRRGKSVAELELAIVREELKKMTELPSIHPHPNPLSSFNYLTSGCTAVPNAAIHLSPAPTLAMLVQRIGIHGANHVMDPSVIGSSSVGRRIENYYMKCANNACGGCYKKKRINGGSHLCSVNPFRSFYRNNSVVEMMNAGKTRSSSGQVTEAAHRNSGSSVTEYAFFPGRGVGSAEEYKEVMRMGSTSTTWCGSGTSFGGAIGLRGGEGSCVTAITGSEEGNVSSVDLSLKLSY